MGRILRKSLGTRIEEIGLIIKIFEIQPFYLRFRYRDIIHPFKHLYLEVKKMADLVVVYKFITLLNFEKTPFLFTFPVL